MVYPCCGNCSKVYSSISSRKEREKKNGHWSEYNIDPDISFNEETKSFHWQTAGCAATAKYKYNIIKHLKSCYSVNKNQRKVADNQIYKACEKEFSKTSNRDDILDSFMLEIIMILLQKIRSQKKELLVKIIQIHNGHFQFAGEKFI